MIPLVVDYSNIASYCLDPVIQDTILIYHPLIKL